MACSFSVQAESLRLASNFIWSRGAPWFGGFSGLEIDKDGSLITLITDRSHLVRARLLRQNNAISAIQFIGAAKMKYRNGSPLKGSGGDSEGLAISSAGQAYVSFEHTHRVTHLDLQTGVTHRLPTPSAFSAFPSNSGLEALAVHPNGTLYTLPEESQARNAPFPLFSYDGAQWQLAHNIPRRGPFLPVGADFDNAGLLYLLERAVSPLGFRSRIRRFDLTAPDLNETTLLTSYPGQFDNLEALSLWQDPAGATRLIMISDDNFFRIQRTQIVEYVLSGSLAPPG